MIKPRIAIISFPGTNGDTENLRTFARCGFDPFVFRWNESREKLEGVDAYFIGAGFSYEDRGRAGMVAARDPIFELLHEEAAIGKVVVGHCNGCQVLVESGLIPLNRGLHMCMGRNVTRCSINGQASDIRAPGFLNEWIRMKRTCAPDRCATSDWEGVMRIPIAHGEGRFTTKDADLITDLTKNDQIAFQYCDADGRVSSDPLVTPNGSLHAIAGLCNPAGNVVAIMPHPERTAAGDMYFISMRKWIERKQKTEVRWQREEMKMGNCFPQELSGRAPRPLEIFIDTIIVNNEERTVEQAARKYATGIKMKQLKYLAPSVPPEQVLSTIGIFNQNKETAYIWKDGNWYRWDADAKKMERGHSPLFNRSLLRRDEPDTGADALGQGGESGTCYTFDGVAESELNDSRLLAVFGNQHASSLEYISDAVMVRPREP